MKITPRVSLGLASHEGLLVYDCYKSGQISEKQWQGHMKYEVFLKWVEKKWIVILKYPSKKF